MVSNFHDKILNKYKGFAGCLFRTESKNIFARRDLLKQRRDMPGTPAKIINNTAIYNRPNVLINFNLMIKSNPIGHERTSRFERTVSEYERYLQISMLREIRKQQSIILDMLKKREPLYVTGKPTRFESIKYPDIYFAVVNVDGKNGDTLVKSQNTVNNLLSDSDIKVQKNVKIENLNQNNGADSKIIYQSINIDGIIDKVTKNVEEKLRYERLRKGYGVG